jgi:hypothetical protein
MNWITSFEKKKSIIHVSPGSSCHAHSYEMLEHPGQQSSTSHSVVISEIKF